MYVCDYVCVYIYIYIYIYTYMDLVRGTAQARSPSAAAAPSIIDGTTFTIFRGSYLKEVTPPRAGAPGKIERLGVGVDHRGGVGFHSRYSCARPLSPAVSSCLKGVGADMPDCTGSLVRRSCTRVRSRFIKGGCSGK